MGFKVVFEGLFHYYKWLNGISALLFCLIFASGQASTGKYPIKNYSPLDYEAGIQNIDFAQNRDMALFVANNLGVLSFNGGQWTSHATRTGKKQRSLAFDEGTDRLYVGSQGEFGYFEQDWQYVSLSDKIPAGSNDFDEVWDVFLVNSTVFFCTFQGIFVYDGDRVTVISNETGFDRSFHISSRLFTQDTQGKLFEIQGLQLVPGLTQGLKGEIVSGLITTNDGYLIFYNSGKVELSMSDVAAAVHPRLASLLEGKYVNHVAQLSDSRLVISTQRAGLYLYDLETKEIENISSADGLQSNACLRTFQDHSGNLWVGMQNGLALIDINSPMRLLNQEINLQGSGYEAYQLEEGTYYTTSNGIYFMSPGASGSTFIPGTEGPSYGMQVISGRLYAGHHTGLFLLQEGKAKRCASTNGLWQIKQLRSQPGFALGGTYSGLHLFKINENEELESVRKIEGFQESSRFFEEDAKGRIWVGQFYKGLYQLTLKEGLTSGDVIKISDQYTDLPISEHIIISRIDDILYLGTEAGIYQLDETSDKIVQSKVFSDLIGTEWVYLLAQGRQKNIYVVTENGVGYIKQVSPNNYVYVPSSLFQLRHAFNNDLLQASANLEEGVIFNANEGFILYDPGIEDRLAGEQRPLLSKVYGVAEDTVLFARQPFESRAIRPEQIIISEGLKVLQFHVEAFEYKHVGRRSFRYFLKGFDTEFGQWTDANVKEYTNLKEGTYEFYVESLNSFGERVSSEPLSLKVEPPIYRSRFMKIFYALLFIIALYMGYRLQKGYYRAKAKKVEQMRQGELAQKQNELQKLKEEQTERELSHVSNLLAASTMNLVVKNEFMENIKEELKEVNLKAELSERKEALSQIVKEIDKALKLQEDWQQFEYHFDRVHGDFLTRLTNEFTDLTPGEQKLCAFLRLKMDTKEIANLMAISVRGVEVARYRLRKKFDLDTYQNLSKFILEY